ncbi:MAG: tRNA1(Val) (adenine(37)-N6)-methyltransferase [Christensenellales bacterium]
MNEHWDDLQLGGLGILRGGKASGYTTDAVLLADFSAPRTRQRVCDLGCGAGILPLLLLGREPTLSLTGLELREELGDLARRSIRQNGLQESAQILQGDIRQIRGILPQKSFDLVISNPPYFAGKGQDDVKHTEACGYQDIAAAAAWLLNNGGRLCVCCPADRLLPMAEALRGKRLEPKRLQLVSSFREKAPYLCLMEAKLGARPGLSWLPQLTIYEAPGQYTLPLKRIYHLLGERET